jgi:hypothetical protein
MVGMTNFKGNYITRDDVKIAKNYLSEKELQILNLLASKYLDFAELQAIEQKPMTTLANFLATILLDFSPPRFNFTFHK